MTKRLGVRILICLASLALGLNAEIMRNGMLQQLNGFHIGNSTGAELGNMFSNILADPENGLIKRAEQALGQRLTEAVENFNVSDTCLNHTEMFLQGLVARQSWAFRMVDSMGKPPPGLMNGNLNWLGSYDECLAIDVHGNVPSFTGRYCTATAVIPQMSAIIGSPAVLRIGLCVPNSCDSNDTTGLLNTLLSLIPMNSSALPHPQVKCQKESIELDTKAKIVIGVMSLFGLIMVIATAYDVIVIQWWSTKSEALPDYKVMKNDCVAVKVTKLSGEQYGTSESLKSTEVNYGAMSNGVSQYDLSKSDSSLVKKEEKYVPGKFGQALLSFSVYTNASKILNTNQPKGTLSAINGIRFVSMTWVIMGHSFGGSLQFAENTGTFFFKMMKRLTFQAIANATVSVDTFFILSGLLVSYLGLKELKKRGGASKFNWGMFYFHRFWRLTPPYMLFLMFYVCLEKYWSDGPLWPQQGTEINDCKDSWWRSLLYINNLIKPNEQCMGWGWYLANDMQFYIVSPLMLIPLYYSKVLGSISCAAFLLCSIISTWVITAANNFGPSILGADQAMMGEYYNKVYVKPWCRVGPYAVGFFTGYLLYKTDCKIKIPKIAVLIGWAFATAIALLVLYGLYDKEKLFPDLSTQVSAFYSATHRSAWGVAVCWVIFACATGHGGFVNTLLSWKALIPLSRLTYCAYLVHLVVMDVYQNSKRSLVYFTDLEEIYWFLAHLVMSYATAFVVSLTFEAPMMGLEKALLGRAKNS